MITTEINDYQLCEDTLLLIRDNYQFKKWQIEHGNMKLYLKLFKRSTKLELMEKYDLGDTIIITINTKKNDGQDQLV